jgi:hypothetical protein
MMIGIASLALAVVVAVPTILGLFGIPCGQWSEPREIMAEATPPQFVRSMDPVTKQYVNVPQLVPSGKIWVPSHDCARLALLGLTIGGTGLALSWRQRKFSWSSALGLTLLLLIVVTVVACDSVLTLRVEPARPIRSSGYPAAPPPRPVLTQPLGIALPGTAPTRILSPTTAQSR